MTLTAWNANGDIAAAGYVIAPEGRYIDHAHGIDWAIIRWTCTECTLPRWAPGPGADAPYCCDKPMTPVKVTI